MSNVQTTIEHNSIVKLYQSVCPDGEITNKYSYIIGLPIHYRFNGQTGMVSREEYIIEDENFPVIDGRVQIGTKMSIVPIGYRFFNDALFLRKHDNTQELKQEEWVELFFINKNNLVSSILFNNSSCRELKKFLAKLQYSNLSLTQVQLNISSVKRENVKGKYSVAEFAGKLADEKLVNEYKEFSQDYPIYQASTIKDTATLTLVSDNYPVQLFGLTYEKKTGLLLKENTVHPSLN
jgi:hypothetical protein